MKIMCDNILNRMLIIMSTRLSVKKKQKKLEWLEEIKYLRFHELLKLLCQIMQK